MRISNINLSTSVFYSCKNASFGSAEDINLEYIKKNRYHLLPDRMKIAVDEALQNGEKISLRDLHFKKYSALKECSALDEAKELYNEFKVVLPADEVVRKKSPNIKKIEQVVKLEDLSLYLLKERWANLKSYKDIAMDLNCKDRAAIAWFVSKMQIPPFPNNYLMLLNATDKELNDKISSKVVDYNNLHRDEILEKNRRISVESVDIQRAIFLETWRRVPHIRAALSELSEKTTKSERMSVFWNTYPEYAKEYGRVKSIVAEELKKEREANKR